MAIFWKDNILKFLGFTLLFMGIFILLVGIGMTFDPDPKDSSVGPPIAIVSFVFSLPGFILIRLGKKAQVKEEKVKAVANIIKSYRRIKLESISEKLAIPVLEVEQHLSAALSARLIRGFIDRTTDEFVAEGAREKDIAVKYCSSCGAPLEKVYLEGETIKCKSCGTIL